MSEKEKKAKGASVEVKKSTEVIAERIIATLDRVHVRTPKF